QAEDGIRDFHVTGVQTCALPISIRTGNAGKDVRGTERSRDRSHGDGASAQRHAFGQARFRQSGARSDPWRGSCAARSAAYREQGGVMVDRPILFSAPMVRALLAGTKTQTRRLIKPQPKLAPHHEPVRVERRGDRRWVWMCHTDRPSYQFATGDWRAPIQPGDRLWVREVWRPDPNGVEDD